MQSDLSFNEHKMFFVDALRILGVREDEITTLGETDIACSCPICGDSRRGNKKRLHLYQKGDVINVNCFNGDCPAKNLTPWKFVKLYAPAMLRPMKDYKRTRYFQDFRESIASKSPKKTLETLEASTVGLTLTLEEPSKTFEDSEVVKYRKFIDGILKLSESEPLTKSSVEKTLGLVKAFMQQYPNFKDFLKS